MQCNTIRQLLHGTITTDSTGMKARVWAVLARLGALSVGKKDKAHNFYQFSRFVCISWFFFLLTGGPLPCLLASFTGSDLCVRVGCPMDCVGGGVYCSAIRRHQTHCCKRWHTGRPRGGDCFDCSCPREGLDWAGPDSGEQGKKTETVAYTGFLFFFSCQAILPQFDLAWIVPV